MTPILRPYTGGVLLAALNLRLNSPVQDDGEKHTGQSVANAVATHLCSWVADGPLAPPESVRAFVD